MNDLISKIKVKNILHVMMFSYEFCLKLDFNVTQTLLKFSFLHHILSICMNDLICKIKVKNNLHAVMFSYDVFVLT